MGTNTNPSVEQLVCEIGTIIHQRPNSSELPHFTVTVRELGVPPAKYDPYQSNPHLLKLQEEEKNIKRNTAHDNLGVKAPYDTSPLFECLTKSLGQKSDEMVDITMLRVNQDPTITPGTSNTKCKIQSREHWTQKTQCQGFLKNLTKIVPTNDTTVFLLVQDMSLAMLNFLYGELHVPISFILSHVKGIQGSHRDELPKLFFSHPPLPYDIELPEGGVPEILEYSFTALGSKRKVEIDDSSRFNLDWRHMAWQSDALSAKERTAILRREREDLVEIWQEGLGDDWKKGRTDDSYDTVKRRIYRPHQLVLENKDAQLRSVQERVSWISIEYLGHNIEIYLFDPPHTFEKYARGAPYQLSSFERPFTHLEKLQINDKLQIFDTTRDFFQGLIECTSAATIQDLKTQCQTRLIRKTLVAFSNTLTTMESVIDDIDRQMANPVRVQENIDAWGITLSSYRLLLSEIAHSVENVTTYLEIISDELGPNSDTTVTGREILKAVATTKRFSRFRSHTVERTDRAFQGLMSFMSIIESQGAIAEASSVGKLTELAFVFIPVSFAATFYSMQIEDLKPSLEKFILLALILLFLAYSFRLFIRGRVWNALKQLVKAPIYRSGLIAKNKSIPISTYFWFYTREIKRLVDPMVQPAIKTIRTSYRYSVYNMTGPTHLYSSKFTEVVINST
ncbi:hypothetical protein TWF694_002299 [Orbilia ellipsospora]|uniref:Uncharacterized protein n=1 Tax=Orbilia ellipsospora TaxID=2528407 RepID=A0AAV9X7P2_9PEZI